jgi:transposase
MLRVQFSKEDVERLRYERFQHPHPRVQRRMEALLLKSQGLAHKQICEVLDISGNTLRKYLRQYEAGGVDALKELRFHQPQSELMAYVGDLEEEFLDRPPATIGEAAARIEELTGIKRSPTQVRVFLKKLGLRRLKVGCLPAKADPQQQAEFEKK